MAERVRVFVCYRKDRSEAEATALCHVLDQDRNERYVAWMDDANLHAGMEWEREIYRQIVNSHVLVVLIGAQTSQSEWVRREIAIAHALGVSVVPLGHGLSQDDFMRELRELDLHHTLGKVSNNLRVHRAGALLAELEAPLTAAYLATRESGSWVRPAPPKIKAPFKQRAASYRVGPNALGIALSVTAGDISRVTNIDVLVNSENDYMQMARFFESTTVSSILRHRGARITHGRYDDAIQHELDKRLEDHWRPVQVSEVFATSAGGPDSDLARVNKARVILHVAAVQAVTAERRLVPFKQPEQIEACVRSVLVEVGRLNREQGRFSPPGTPQRQEQEARATIDDGQLRSVIFPLLGTGQGGAAVSDVISPMLAGLVGFVDDPDNRDTAAALRELYISAYTQEDVDTVVAHLDRELIRL